MNKIYRVVWNQSLGTWVAVSETAKSKTKSRSKTAGVVAGLALVVAAVSPSALADYSAGGGTASGGTSIAIGNGSAPAVSSAAEAIAIGATTKAAGSQSTVIGNDIQTSSTAEQAVVIGSNFNSNPAVSNGRGGVAIGSGLTTTMKSPVANGTGSLALGSSGDGATKVGGVVVNANGATTEGAYSAALMAGASTTTSAVGSIAFGVNAKVESAQSVAIGDGSGVGTGISQAVAIGSQAKSQGIQAVALGAGASATSAGAIALGQGASAGLARSVALGQGSTVSSATGTSYLTSTSVAGTGSVVSVGAAGSERRIQNVADGSADQDAVTVNQLKAAKTIVDQQGIDTAAALGGGSKYNAATGAITAPSYSVDGTTVGSVGAAITNVDARTTTNSSNITTLQNQTFKIQANKDTATAVGADDTIAFADGNNISITRVGNTISVATSATPTFTTVTSTGAISGGSLAVTGAATVGGALTTTGIANLNGGASLNGNRLSNVGAATAGTDAVNLTQLNTAIAGAGNTDALGTSVASNLGGGAAYNKTTGTIDKLGYVLDDGSNTGATTTYTNVGAALGNLNGRTTTNTADIADLASGKAGLVQQASNTAEITVGKDSLGTSVNFANSKGTTRQLTGLADGSIAAGSTDAVTGGQLNTTNTNVSTAQTTANTALAQANKGFNITAEGAALSKVQPGNTIDFASADSNIVVGNDKNNLTFGLAKDVAVDSITTTGTPGNTAVLNSAGTYVRNDNGNEATYGAAAVQLADRFGNSVNITKGGLDFTDTNGDATGPSIKVGGIDAGSKQITRVGSAGTLTANNTNAASGADVFNAVASATTALTNTGLNFTATDATAGVVNKKLGETLTIQGGITDTATVSSGENVITRTDSKGNINIELAKNAKFDSITTTGTPGNTAVLNSAGTYVRNDNGNEATYGAAAVQLADRFGNSVNITKGGLDFTDINGDATGPSIKVGGIDAGSKQITRVGSAGDITQAVNAGNAVNAGDVNTALTKLNTTVTNTGFNITSNGSVASDNVKLGETVNFTNTDSNLVVSHTNNAVNYNLADNVTVDSLTANDGKGNVSKVTASGTTVTDGANTAVYGATGLTATNAAGNSTVVNQTGLSFTDSKGVATGPSISAGGINAGGERITNVADAVDLDDAVTLGQALDVAESIGTSVADNLGGGSKYDPATNSVTAPTYTLDDGTNTGTGTDFDNVGAALGNLDGRTTTNTADIADLTDNLNNGTIGIVQQANNTAEITVGAATGGTSVNFANDKGTARQLTGVASAGDYTDTANANHAVNASDLNTAIGDVTSTGFNITSNGDLASDNVKLGEVVDFTNTDSNLVVSHSDNGINYNLADDITVDSVTAGNTTLDNAGVAIDDGMGNTATLTSNGTDVAQLDGNGNLVQGAHYGSDGLYTTNQDGDLGVYTNQGFGVVNQADGKATVGTADGIQVVEFDTTTGQLINGAAYTAEGFTATDAAGNTTTIDAGNISVSGVDNTDPLNPVNHNIVLNGTTGQISGVADGTAADHAVNKGQLDAVADDLTDLTAGAVQYERNLDGSVNYDRVTLNGTNGTVLGNVASGEISATSTEAVNGSQIHAANTSIADALGGNSTVNADGTLSAPTYTLDDGTNTGTGTDFDNVGDALGNLDGRTTTNTADIADLTDNLNNGTIGLVQQASNTAEITVGKDSLGSSIDFANANGEARQLTNVANGVGATDAANMQQLTDLTTALGGNVDPNTGVIIAPEYNVNNYSIDPNTGMMIVTPSVVNNVGDALNSIGGQINNLQTSDIGIKYFRTNSTQSDAVALGDDSIAIGPVSAAEQQGNRTISMGVDASSAADSAIAIGDGATIAQGADQSIAIGNGAQVNGEQSISIGTGNIVNGDRSGAIGDPSIINGSDSYSVGNNNTVDSDDTFVLGNNVTATVDGSVVLGSSSAATTGAGVAGYALQSAAAADQLAIAATTSTTGAVAVGDAASGVYRQITGVAAGTEDSDAVNVAQLKAVDNALASLTSGIGNGSIGLVQQVASGATITVGAATGGTTVNFAGTDGNRQLTGVAASGQNNAAATVGQIGALAGALGGGAAVNADGTLTAPTYNVQGGTQGNVGDALGALDTALNDVRSANQSLNNAAVQYDKNADGTVNKGQITLGGGADGTTLTNVRDGALTAGSKDAVNGGQLFETNQQVNNLASQISNGTVGLVQQAANNAQVTVAAGTGGTSVNMAGTAGNRTVTGVQSGAVTATSSDAINGSQLHASNTSVANALGGGAAVDASGNITAPTYQVAGETASNVGDALSKLDNQSAALGNRLDQAFYRTNERIDKVEKRANAGIAAALSMESAPFVPGKFTYSLGAGFHGGENAVGATLRRTSDSGRWSLTGGVATASEGGASARIGISGIID